MKSLLIITLPVLAIAAIILIALRPPKPVAPPARAAQTHAHVASDVPAAESAAVPESAPASRSVDVASALGPAAADGVVGNDDENPHLESHATIQKTEDQ